MFVVPRARARVAPYSRSPSIRRHAGFSACILIALCLTRSVQASDMPASPYPADGATKWGTGTSLQWWVTDPSGSALQYIVYFGTTPDPPLFDIVNEQFNHNGQSVALGLSFSTTYYWRVVARDTQSNETTGPTWSFTTKAVNEPPQPPEYLSPSDGASDLPVNPTINCYAHDFEVANCTVDVYLGTDPNPPLVASDHGWTYHSAALQPSTKYYWRLVSRDSGGLTTSGPIWSFTTINTPNQIPDDPSNPRPKAYSVGENPLLEWDGTDPDGEVLNFDVYLGHGTNENHPMQLIGTTTEHSFQIGPLNLHTRYFWRVVARDSYWTVRGPQWWFDYGSVPVLFSQFDARQKESSVEVRWMLQSDEAMESYTLFRHEGATGPAVPIASAPVQGVEGSYVDNSVAPGKTYSYELLVRTTDGDEFRSPVATVLSAALGLVLHQNVPNPFNPLTTIRYDLPANARVRLSIIDVAGKRVRTLVDEQQTAGSRSTIWNGRDDAGRAVASGVYFYVLDAGKDRLTRKLVLLK